MNLKIKSYIIPIIVSLIGCFSMVSCVDETIPAENNGGNATGSGDEGYGIGVTMNLQSMTRAGEDGIADFVIYEDYIDPEKISLLFFYDGGDKADCLIKQFLPRDLSVIPIKSSIDGTTQSWYVRIPEEKIEKDGFDQILRENNFKVAATANWNWKDELILSPGDPIKKLHHLEIDSQYTDGALSFLADEGKMGQSTSWVKNIYKKAHFADDGGATNSAEYWIRNNWWDYKNNEYEASYRGQYGDLWLVWNFDAAYRSTSDEPSTSSFDFMEGNGKGKSEGAWALKNFTDLNEWLKDSENLTSYKVGTQSSSSTEEEASAGNIIPNDNGCFEYVGTARRVEENIKDTERIGILLPQVTMSTSKENLPDQNYFIFNLVASATINIKWGAKDTSRDAILQLQRRNYKDDNDSKDNDSKYQLTTQEKYTTTPVADSKSIWNFGVTGDSEYIYIFAKNDNVVIYEIEYIASDYLYNIEREGIMLGTVSGRNLIPMYGIQSYAALKDGVWAEGTLFNLSNYNHISTVEEDSYDHKEISMLRSVAKVELKLPRNFNAHNVYLRSMNRRSRNEPMDVSTPTDQIWMDDDIQTFIEHHPTNCEWSQLNSLFKNQDLTPFYDPNDDNPDNYKKKLAWYYGSWADNGEVGDVTVPESPLIRYNSQGDEGYPRIINPRIKRSDFVKFYPTGIAEGIYDRFILYVPEKFVDDPDEEGIPKVCHIEFRRGTDNDEQGLGPADPSINIDDNYCYRIYFTENGFAGSANDYPDFEKKDDGTYNTWENSYEQNTTFLQKHWPIMRNHVYSFIVDDASQNVLIVNLKVLPWKNVEENVYNW